MYDCLKIIYLGIWRNYILNWRNYVA